MTRQRKLPSKKPTWGKRPPRLAPKPREPESPWFRDQSMKRTARWERTGLLAVILVIAVIALFAWESRRAQKNQEELLAWCARAPGPPIYSSNLETIVALCEEKAKRARLAEETSR